MAGKTIEQTGLSPTDFIAVRKKIKALSKDAKDIVFHWNTVESNWEVYEIDLASLGRPIANQEDGWQ